MTTEFIEHITDSAITRAADVIRRGGIVGFPTETVYGLGANALDGEAVRRIFAAKGRPSDNPLICHIAEPEDISKLASVVPQNALDLAGEYWPGPLTIVLPRRPEVPNEVTAGLDTVGIRLPSHPVARALIREAGVPIAAPSANASGRPSPTTAYHVMEDMDGRVDMILDGGACGVGVESTVVSLAGEMPRLLRPGGVSLEMLERVLGHVEVDRAIRENIGDDVKVSAPGMKYRHYAPRAPVVAVTGAPEHSAAYILGAIEAGDGVICYEEFRGMFSDRTPFVRSLGGMDDASEHARRIFDDLRAFDSLDVKRIFAQCPPDIGVSLAVANRLKKAAGFNIVET